MQLGKTEAMTQIAANLEEARAAADYYNGLILERQEKARAGRRAAYAAIKDAVKRKQDLIELDIDWPDVPKSCDYNMRNLLDSIAFLERQLKTVITIADDVFTVAKDSVIWRAVIWEVPYWARPSVSC